MSIPRTYGFAPFIKDVAKDDFFSRLMFLLFGRFLQLLCTLNSSDLYDNNVNTVDPHKSVSLNEKYTDSI